MKSPTYYLVPGTDDKKQGSNTWTMEMGKEGSTPQEEV
jgi:hypothetical protein